MSLGSLLKKVVNYRNKVKLFNSDDDKIDLVRILEVIFLIGLGLLNLELQLESRRPNIFISDGSFEIGRRSDDGKMIFVDRQPLVQRSNEPGGEGELTGLSVRLKNSGDLP